MPLDLINCYVIIMLLTMRMLVHRQMMARCSYVLLGDKTAISLYQRQD